MISRRRALLGGLISAGAAASPRMAQPITVEVLRGFMHCGAAVPIGAVLELPADLALELLAMAKVQRAKGPMEMETAGVYRAARRPSL